MQNLLQINYKEDECIDTAYVERRLKEENVELHKKMQTLREEKKQFDKNARMPHWMLFLMCGIVFCIECGSIYGLLKLGAQYAICFAVVLWFTGLVAAVFMVSVNKKYKAKVTNSSAYLYCEERIKKLESEIYHTLEIPEDAVTVDGLFISAFQTTKAPREKSNTTYVPRKLKIFRKDSCLCLGDSERELKIPLAHIITIECKNKTLSISKWNNRGDKPDAEKLQQYRIRKSNAGYFVKPYYDMLIQNGAKEFHIIIPCYDIDAYLKVTGKTVA